MSYQPIHLVCLLDLNGVAQAEGSQEQLLAALGRREGGFVTTLMSCTEPTSQHFGVIFVYGYFRTKNQHSLPASAAFTQPEADHKTLTVIDMQVSYLFCFAVIF